MIQPVDSPDRELVAHLLDAYRHGFFPMAEPARHGRPGRMAWFNPDPRAILPLEAERDDGAGFHVPRSLRRVVRQGQFRITTDTCFEGVMRGCAAPRPGEPQSWIDERIIGAYSQLHKAGHAHSIEAWVGEDETKRRRDEETKRLSDREPTRTPRLRRLRDEASGTNTADRDTTHTLVGGLYGVHLGGAFFAESKFSRPDTGGTNASKVCLVHLVHHLRRRGFTLLDVQFSNPHLEQFGIVEISRTNYLKRLGEAVEKSVEWLPFEAEKTAESV